MPTVQRTLARWRHSSTHARESATSVATVTISFTPAAAARASTSGSCRNRFSSVRWQWVSIMLVGATLVSPSPAREEGDTSVAPTSKRCFKRILRVPDLRLAALRPDDRDHVEPRGWLRDAVAAQVKL